jgi:hypothetical protein
VGESSYPCSITSLPCHSVGGFGVFAALEIRFIQHNVPLCRATGAPEGSPGGFKLGIAGSRLLSAIADTSSDSRKHEAPELGDMERGADRKLGRDQGEAEAVIQASKRSADVVLTDDPLGKKWAEKHSLECHGTIWVCRELRFRGYLTELSRLLRTHAETRAAPAPGSAE